MLGAGLGGRFDLDGEGYGLGTPRGSRSGAGLTERLWARERGDVDPAGNGVGTPGGARSGAFLKVLQAPSVGTQEANAGIGGGAFSFLSAAPGGRLDLDGEGYGLGTPRGSRSGAGLILSRVPLQSQAESAPLDFASLIGPASRASLFAPRGRLDVDSDGYGLGTPRGSRSGAGLLLSVAPPASLAESRPSELSPGGGRVASLGAPRGRYDVDGEGYGLGTPRGSRSGAGLVLLVQQQPSLLQHPLAIGAAEASLGGRAVSLGAPRGRLDVDGEGYGLGTPRGSRSGAGLALLSQALAAAPPPAAVTAPVAPLMSGMMLSAPHGRLDVDGAGLGTGTPRGSRSGAGLAFVGYAPVYAVPPRG